MVRKVFWLTAYILTGLGMIGMSILNNGGSFNTLIIAVVGIFYIISLNTHFRELRK